MDLQEVLRKQKERGFKKPLAAASNTLSIKDYLSDPNASRPYIDDISAAKILSVVKNTNEDVCVVEIEKAADAAIVPVASNAVSTTVESEQTTADDISIATSPVPVEVVPVKQPAISDTTATQEFRSATQQLDIPKTKATQQFRSATQTATQQFKKNHLKA